MNNEPVTREEFETLKGICEGMAQHNVGTCDLLRGLHNRICDLESRLADASAILPERIMYVERLLDGVKDAVCKTAEQLGNELGTNIYGEVCHAIENAQQPPASAEGMMMTLDQLEQIDRQNQTPSVVVIDPAASAAATTNARATELGRCENCGTPYYTLEGFCGTCSPSKL